MTNLMTQIQRYVGTFILCLAVLSFVATPVVSASTDHISMQGHEAVEVMAPAMDMDEHCDEKAKASDEEDCCSGEQCSCVCLSVGAVAGVQSSTMGSGHHGTSRLMQLDQALMGMPDPAPTPPPVNRF